MTSSSSPSFEYLLQMAQDLPCAETDVARVVKWCDKNELVGIAKQASGAIEIFLLGPELHPSSSLVRRHVRFDLWRRTSGAAFQANRLVLPNLTLFIPVSAFLVEELLRNGITDDLGVGFSKTEPLIEVVLRRTVLSEEQLLGLLGELKLLEAFLLQVGGPKERKLVLDMWLGHERSSRDFVTPFSAVEVKTTRSLRSTHVIENVKQVSPKRDASGRPVERLFLASFGMTSVEPGSGLTLPMLVDRILHVLGDGSDLDRSDLQLRFLDRLANYGDAGVGYVHDEMRDWAAYQVEWAQTFVRIYDMCSATIKVLTPELLRPLVHVDASTVSFKLVLPEKVDADLNPQIDLLIFAKESVAGLA